MTAVTREALPEPQPRELTAEQARRLFDERARQRTGLSGEEFVRAWEAGELDPDDDDVLAVWMLLPLAR